MGLHIANTYNRRRFSVIQSCIICDPIKELIAVDCSSETQSKKCAPSEVSGQPARSSSLIRIFTGCILDGQERKVSSCEQQRLWLDGVDTQAYSNHIGQHVRRTVCSLGGFFSSIILTRLWEMYISIHHFK